MPAPGAMSEVVLVARLVRRWALLVAPGEDDVQRPGDLVSIEADEPAATELHREVALDSGQELVIGRTIAVEQRNHRTYP